jgi:hypothetical protein
MQARTNSAPLAGTGPAGPRAVGTGGGHDRAARSLAGIDPSTGSFTGFWLLTTLETAPISPQAEDS